jgi:hypothetical protein
MQKGVILELLCFCVENHVYLVSERMLLQSGKGQASLEEDSGRVRQAGDCYF